jgi:hypothetical protein
MPVVMRCSCEVVCKRVIIGLIPLSSVDNMRLESLSYMRFNSAHRVAYWMWTSTSTCAPNMIEPLYVSIHTSEMNKDKLLGINISVKIFFTLTCLHIYVPTNISS